MEGFDAIDHLRQFVGLQRLLWQALRERHSGALTAGLPSIPKHGQLAIENEVWEFQRHGSGVLFSEVSGKRRIDLHDAFAGPEKVDPWRLATYFGSLGRTGEKLVSRAAGNRGTLEERIGSWLARLASQGVLCTEEDGLYKFSPDS